MRTRIKTRVNAGSVRTRSQDRNVVTVTRQGSIKTVPNISSGDIPVFVYDVDYQALLNRATTLGYSQPSLSQKLKQNQLVIDLKAAGIWTQLDVFYVFATDGDSNFATLNWKNPLAFQVTRVGSPAFNTNSGFFCDAAQNLETNWSPAVNGVNYTNTNAGVFVATNTMVPPSDTARIIRSTGSSVGLTLRLRRAVSDICAAKINKTAGGAEMTFSGNSDARGFYHFYTSFANVSNNNYRLFKDGVVRDSTAQNNVGSPIATTQLGHDADTNPITGGLKGNICCYGAGGHLEGLEVGLYNAWNNYFTSL